MKILFPKYGGTVAACGLAQGMDFPATVAPFILRGVTLAGIDSVYYPQDRRAAAWQRIARDLPVAVIDSLADAVSLGGAIEAAEKLLDGRVSGRLVVDLQR